MVRDDLASAAQQKRKHARIRQAKEHTKLELDAARLNKKITPERRKEIEDVFYFFFFQFLFSIIFSLFSFF